MGGKMFKMSTYTPEGDIMGIDWASGNKGELTARANTKSNEPGGANYEAAKAIAAAKEVESLASAQASETIAAKKRAIARSRSVYTSPLGLSTEATTSRKFLLGQ